MPGFPTSTAAAAPAGGSSIASGVVQLLRSPTDPTGLPTSIVSGLASTDSATQLTAIAELRAFVRSFFFLDIQQYCFVITIATAGIICAILLIGIPVVLHRFYHDRLTVFRLERRMQGLYIIPNAINCFLLLEGAYGVLTVAFNFIFWQLFHQHVESFVKWFQPFRLLIWIFLYIGAFLTGWGSFYTAPGALDKPTAARHKLRAKGHLPWPMIVNLSCLGTPVALIISLIPPVCLSSVTMVRAFHKYKDWDHSLQVLLDSTPAGSLIDPTAVNEFRAQAFAIFKQWTLSYYYIDIGYLLWSFWALLFLAFYVPAGGVLVFLLFRQVRRQKAVLFSYQRKLEIEQAQEGRQTEISVLTSEQAGQGAEQHAVQMQDNRALQPHVEAERRQRPAHRLTTNPSSRYIWSAADPSSRIGAPLEHIYEDRGASDGSEGTGPSGATVSFKGSHEIIGLESALRHEPPASHRVHGALTPEAVSGMGHAVSLAEEGDKSSTAHGQDTGSTPLTPRTLKAPSMFRKLMRFETASSNNSKEAAKRRRLSVLGGPLARYKYLRRCLVNLLILYFGIISAACFFGAVTIYLAAVEYEHALQGPEALSHPIEVAETTVCLVSAVFGALTIGSIIFRNFDNPLPETSQNSDGEVGGMRRRFQRNTLKTFNSGAANASATHRGAVAHDKTRTLPAVPESVDLEASMSMAQSRPHMALDTSMKFAMTEQSGLPGGFVIRPDDQLGSVVSAGDTPEMEDASRSGFYDSTGRMARTKPLPLRPAHIPRALLARERDATMSVPQDVTESFGLTSVPMIAVNSDLGRSCQGSVEREEAVEVEQQLQNTLDSTAGAGASASAVAAYPSFDQGVLETERESTSPRVTVAPSSTRRSTDARSKSPVLKRYSRLSDNADSETPASKIAREWAQSQYLSAPLPVTPTEGEARSEEEEEQIISSPAGSNAKVDESHGVGL